MGLGVDAQANPVTGPGLLRSVPSSLDSCLALAGARSLHARLLHLTKQLGLKQGAALGDSGTHVKVRGVQSIFRSFRGRERHSAVAVVMIVSWRSSGR